MRHGKKPTRKQKIGLGKAGLSPDNWLVIKEKRNGELIVLHKNTNSQNRKHKRRETNIACTK